MRAYQGVRRAAGPAPPWAPAAAPRLPPPPTHKPTLAPRLPAGETSALASGTMATRVVRGSPAPLAPSDARDTSTSTSALGSLQEGALYAEADTEGGEDGAPPDRR